MLTSSPTLTRSELVYIWWLVREVGATPCQTPLASNSTNSGSFYSSAAVRTAVRYDATLCLGSLGWQGPRARAHIMIQQIRSPGQEIDLFWKSFAYVLR